TYAAWVDGCRRLTCPKHRSLHSVLYAAEYRGRDYAPTGAVEFFDEVRGILKDGRLALNPLYDSVLERSDVFAPELALLDRQVEAYERDIGRARRAVVNVLRAPVPFKEWFPTLQRLPLQHVNRSEEHTSE